MGLRRRVEKLFAQGDLSNGPSDDTRHDSAATPATLSSSDQEQRQSHSHENTKTSATFIASPSIDHERCHHSPHKALVSVGPTATHIATSSEHYQHSALNYRSSIRLLILLPGDFGTLLKCHITEFERTQIPPYEALSYAWDDPSEGTYIRLHPRRFISVFESTNNQEKTIKLTHHLHDCLQRLRGVEPRYLWIDALCINQDDLVEKGHQVAHMGSIYRNAARVLVWLGRDNRWHPLRPLHEMHEYRDSRSVEHGVVQLAEFSWFTRVWTVQEFLLARDVVFLVGKQQLTLDVVESAFDSAISARSDLLAANGITDISLDSVSHIQTLLEYRRRMASAAGAANRPPMTLMRLFMDLTCQRHCSDDRDRLYGVLGLAQDNHLTPDYTLTTEQLFADFIAKHLRSGDFSILHATYGKRYRLPSYVPGFSNQDSGNEYTAKNFPMYHNKPKLLPQVAVDQLNRMILRGVSAGTVLGWLRLARSHGKWPRVVCTSSPLEEIYQDTLDKMVSQSSKVKSEYQHPRSTADPKGLSQTSHGKRYLKRWRKTYGQTSLLDVIIRTVRLDERPYQGLDPEQTLTSQQQSRIEGRYLFWSTAGYIGLANAQPVEGHEIVLLDGDTAPLVLAKDEDYRIWCNCYLYGWMYGLGKNGRALSDKMGLSGHRVDPVTGKKLEARDFSIK